MFTQICIYLRSQDVLILAVKESVITGYHTTEFRTSDHTETKRRIGWLGISESVFVPLSIRISASGPDAGLARLPNQMNT